MDGERVLEEEVIVGYEKTSLKARSTRRGGMILKVGRSNAGDSWLFVPFSSLHDWQMLLQQSCHVSFHLSILHAAFLILFTAGSQTRTPLITSPTP